MPACRSIFEHRVSAEARRLLEAHGAHASAVAREMIEALTAIGDEARANEWHQIARAIKAMMQSGWRSG